MEIYEVLRKLKPILGDEATRRAWEQLQLVDAKTGRLVEYSLRRKLADATGASFDDALLLEPIPAERAGGSIRLGRVVYGDRDLHGFGLRPGELIQHLAIFGRSGAGKTNVAMLLLRELHRARVPFLVLDWKKNYRDLLALPDFRDVVVYTVGRDHAPFFFNPLIPPRGVEPKEWLKKLVEIMQHAYFLGEGVAFVLQEVFDDVYWRFGVYGQPKAWPTFRDVLTVLERRERKGRESGWSESAHRALGVLTFGAIDWVLNSGAHIPLEQVLRQSAVLELDALTNSDKTFLIEALLLWIHHHRLHEGGREQLKHVLVIEEAHHVLLKKKQELTGAEAVTDVLLREVREFGEAIVLLDQLPSLISKPALENSFTTIGMNLKEKGDVTAAAKAMLLESEARFLGHLAVGQGIVKLQARWTKPFLVEFPHFYVPKGTVTDAQVSARFADSLNVETAARLMKQGVDALVRLFDDTFPGARVAANQNAATIKEPASLTPEERSILQDVTDHPTSTVTERYARLRTRAETGTQLIAALVERGMLHDSTLSINGSHLRLLSLTPTGRSILGLPPETGRLGGSVHRFWVDSFVKALRAKGLRAEVEAPLDGHAADIVTEVRGERVAIEVETGRSDWRANVDKCLRAVDSVIIAATSAELLEEMRSEDLAQDIRAGVKVLLAKDLLAQIERGDLSPDSGASGEKTADSDVNRADSGDSDFR